MTTTEQTLEDQHRDAAAYVLWLNQIPNKFAAVRLANLPDLGPSGAAGGNYGGGACEG